MNGTLNVHLRHRPEPDDLAVLTNCLDGGVALTIGEDCPAPEAVGVLVNGRPETSEIDACPGLHTLVIPYAGLPKETRDLLLTRPDIAVHNLHHNAVVSAEMAVALLLAAAKMIVPMDRSLRKDHWSGRGKDNRAVLLAGKTALILGYGAIGSRVAAALGAMGMAVLAVKRNLERAEVRDGVDLYPAAHLHELLPQAAALVVSVPLTDETRDLVGAEELALLPEGAVLVNVSRGPVVSEEALYEALRSEHLHSAGIDVWYRYPGREGDPSNTAPSDFPFRDLPNVVMSPHRGGWLHEVEAIRMRHLGRLLNALARGEAAPGRVDLRTGY